MYASRADAILKLWKLVHVGRPVQVEREEMEGAKPRSPGGSSSKAPEAGAPDALASAAGT